MVHNGGKAEDIALGFKDGIGGIVNASRSLMCAYKSDRWKEKYTEHMFPFCCHNALPKKLFCKFTKKTQF